MPTAPTSSVPDLRSNKWLRKHHVIYDYSAEWWDQNERRLFGAHEVLSELTRFDWEEENGEHYTKRQAEAIYTNFADRFATVMVGHLMRHAPGPEGSLSFGTLGKVRRLQDLSNAGPAEMFYYNTDGVGNDGSKWDNYWTYVAKNAVGTGHRWVLCEGPPSKPKNRGDERRGLRPFLCDYSPLDVLNWHYVNGRLVYAVIRRPVRYLQIVDDDLEGNEGEFEYLAMVANGYNIGGPLAQVSATGGWMTFDAEGTYITKGSYASTKGEVPMVPLYYERVRANDRRMSMSRSGIFEMGQAAVAHMNLDSAANFDAWDAGASVGAVLGGDEDGFNLFVNKLKQGTRWAPLPRAADATVNPEIQDASQGAVAAGVFDTRIKAIEDTAEQLMWNELHSAPYASGESRRILFTDTRAPRLAVFASEIESAQNASIRWTEMMWKNGTTPSGSIEWTKKFDLLDPMNAARVYFEIQALSGLKAEDLDSKVMAMVARSNGFLGDTAEYEQALQQFKASAEKNKEMTDANIAGAKAQAQAKNAVKGKATGGSGGSSSGSGGRKTGTNSRPSSATT